MNLTTATLAAKVSDSRMIYRESKLFHHRGIQIPITDGNDIHATDWKVVRRPITPNHTDVIRGFHILSEARYAAACLRPGIADDIMIGFYGEDRGGIGGEFCIEWVTLGGKDIPRLKAFDGSWNTLRYFADLLEIMAVIDDANISPRDFVQILLSLGLKDMTKREVPMQPSR